jgi:hypothetical protein
VRGRLRILALIEKAVTESDPLPLYPTSKYTWVTAIVLAISPSTGMASVTLRQDELVQDDMYLGQQFQECFTGTRITAPAMGSKSRIWDMWYTSENRYRVLNYTINVRGRAGNHLQLRAHLVRSSHIRKILLDC